MDQQNVTTDETSPVITLEEAEKYLGTGHDPTVENIFKCFGVKHWAATENDELTKDHEFILDESRRVLCRTKAVNQIADPEKRRFDIQGDFSDIQLKIIKPNGDVETRDVECCDACRGTGEIYKFAKKPIEVQCLKCKNVTIVAEGETIVVFENTIHVDGVNKSDESKYQHYLGKVVENCLSCKATGRYIREMEDDLRINVQCKTCHGKNIDGKSKDTQILHKCKTCKGKRSLKIPVLAPLLKSTTTCKRCHGKGYVPVNPLNMPANPVLTQELAKVINNL